MIQKLYPHIKYGRHLELSSVDVNFTIFRCTPITDTMSCRDLVFSFIILLKEMIFLVIL